MPRDFQWSGFRSFPAMRTRVKHAQGPEMPRVLEWSGFSSFPAMRTRVKHVHGLEMPRNFSKVWFQIFSGHADTSQARARTGNAARFSVGSGLSSFPAMRTRVKHFQGLEMPRNFQWSGFRSFPAMRPRAKHVQGLEMPRDFQWSGFSSFPARRTRVNHVHGLEMPHNFSMVWFQIFSRYADTDRKRRVIFYIVLFPTIPISMQRVLAHSRISNAERFFLSGDHLLCFISPNSH
jgi:hypothetical protein